MSDDEGGVHVCDICQEIFLGTDELEQHMKEDHADKEENGDAEKGSKRSRSSSGDSGSKEERRREEKKMKKHKHRDRSRSREKHKEKKEDRKSSMDGFIDDEDGERNKLKKFLDKGHNFDADKGTIGVAKKAFASEGTVQEHDNLAGPQCPKCDQICKDNANLKNHILSHYYHDFYRVTPDAKPFPCPTCGKENRDRITMIRHFAFSHGMIYELTDVTPEMINDKGKGKGPRPVDNTEIRRKEKEHKHVKRYDEDSDDEKFKARMAAKLANPTDGPTEGKSSFGKHAKEHKHKKEKKHKEHKDDRKHETEEDRRIRKEKKRSEKDRERKSRDGANPLSMLSKELTPDSRGSPVSSTPQDSSWGESKRRIAHSAQRSASNSPEREAAPPPPQASAQADSDDDFGDLPAPVFAE